MVENGIVPSSQALAIFRSARHRRCACRWPMLAKKSCSPLSASSASFAAPGAADGQDSARRLNAAIASCLVVASGDRSKPRTPGAKTPATAPASDASDARAAAAARSAAVDMPATGSKSSSSSPPAAASSSSPTSSSSPAASSASSASSSSSSSSSSSGESSSGSDSSSSESESKRGKRRGRRGDRKRSKKRRRRSSSSSSSGDGEARARKKLEKRSRETLEDELRRLRKKNATRERRLERGSRKSSGRR
mmetsp:Transcript_7669/g.30281  ORF Transcript_7669/g.30281 Transcript_7669/m.30281 type:complete len:250 (-) Transcript_7669:804-1553(-)